jgi:hypothetical protein
VYAEIRIRGQIDDHWSAWFEDLEIIQEAERDETLLRGTVIDQAALYGLLAKLRDLGLALLSVDVSEDVEPGLDPKAPTPP